MACSYCCEPVEVGEEIVCPHCESPSHWTCLGLPRCGTQLKRRLIGWIRESGALVPCRDCKTDPRRYYKKTAMEKSMEAAVEGGEAGKESGVPGDKSGAAKGGSPRMAGVRHSATPRPALGRPSGAASTLSALLDASGQGRPLLATPRHSTLAAPPDGHTDRRPRPERLYDPTLSYESFDMSQPLETLYDGPSSLILEAQFVHGKYKGQSTAIKFLSKEREKGFLRELEALSYGHPNIVALIAAFQANQQFHLCLELCAKGNLANLVKSRGSVAEAGALRITAQVASALQYLHSHTTPVTHRQVQPENILLTWDLSAKLADFGDSALGCARITPFYAGNSFTRVDGAKAFQAPELVSEEGSDYRVDTWSLGVTWFFMLMGAIPYGEKAGKYRAKYICDKGLPAIPLDKLHQPFRDILSTMVKRERNLRVELSELLGLEETKRALVPKLVTGAMIASAPGAQEKLKLIRDQLIRMNKGLRSQALHKLWETAESEMGETETRLGRWGLLRGFFRESREDEAAAKLAPGVLSNVFMSHYDGDGLGPRRCVCVGGRDPCPTYYVLLLCEE